MESSGATEPAQTSQATNGANGTNGAPSREALIAELSGMPSDGGGESGAPEGTHFTEAEPTPAGDSKPPSESATESKAATLDDRLDVLQRLEAKRQEKAAAEKGDIRKRLEELTNAEAERQAELESLRQWKQSLAERMRINPSAVLDEIAVPPDEREYIAKQTYLSTKRASGDAQSKEQAAASLRERELVARIDAQAAKIAELEKSTLDFRQSLEQREAQAKADGAIREYIGHVATTVDDTTPLVKHMIAKDADGAAAELRRATEYLFEEFGEAPDPRDVLQLVEHHRRKEFEKFGIDAYQALGLKAKHQTQQAGEKRSATTVTTITGDIGSPAKPRPAQISDDDLRRELVRELESGKF